MTPSSELHCSPVGPAQLAVAQWELPVAEGVRAKMHLGGPGARTAPPSPGHINKALPMGLRGPGAWMLWVCGRALKVTDEDF